MPASCDCATAVLGLREAPGGTCVLVFVLRCVGSKVDSKTKLAALSFCCGWELPLPPLKHLSRIPYCLLTLPKLITRQRAGYLPSVKLSKALPATPELGPQENTCPDAKANSGAEALRSDVTRRPFPVGD